MKKIKCVFQREGDGETKRHGLCIVNAPEPACQWVLDGEGIATRKYDGTACLVRGGKLYKRYDCKKGKTPPPGFEPCDPEGDSVTGHWPGWLLVSESDPADWMHRLAPIPAEDGTYELCGPKVGQNPEGPETYQLLRHGAEVIDMPVRTYEAMREVLAAHPFEGVVFHHPDGRMAKLRRNDYGLPYKPKQKRAV